MGLANGPGVPGPVWLRSSPTYSPAELRAALRQNRRGPPADAHPGDIDRLQGHRSPRASLPFGLHASRNVTRLTGDGCLRIRTFMSSGRGSGSVYLVDA